MTTKKQQATAKRNIKKAAKSCTAKKNDCAFVEKTRHSSRQRRSQGLLERTSPIKIDVGVVPIPRQPEASAVEISAGVISGRLFCPPCENSICFAFSRDLLRLFSGHLYLICLQ